MVVSRALRELAVGVQALHSWGLAASHQKKVMGMMGQARLAFHRLGCPASIQGSGTYGRDAVCRLYRRTVPTASSGQVAASTASRFDLLAVLGPKQRHRGEALIWRHGQRFFPQKEVKKRSER